jgi:putative phage-type endonuclease
VKPDPTTGGKMQIPKPPHGSLEWHQIRHRDEQDRVRFGASEAPILAGVSKYETITSLALRKWSPPEVNEPNAAMMRGNILEPALITYAEQILQQPVTTPDVMYANGRFIATLDGLTEDGATIVEAKTTVAYSSDDELPEEYFWQVMAQFACVPDAHTALVVVLDRKMRLGSWTVTRSSHQEQIGELVLRADLVGAMFDCGELPADAEPTESEVKRLFPTPDGAVELTQSEVALLDEWQAWKQQRELAETEEQKARDKIARMLGGHEAGTFGGVPVITFKTRKGVSRLDTKSLERDYPEIVANYKTAGAPTRIMRLTGGSK